MQCEVVLLVSDIDLCRHFYREVLGLGEPVMDSNFQTVFQIGDDTVLVLEKSGRCGAEPGLSSCCPAFHLEDLPGVEARMAKNSTPLEEGFARMGKKVLRGKDPEGNSFWLICP